MLQGVFNKRSPAITSYFFSFLKKNRVQEIKQSINIDFEGKVRKKIEERTARNEFIQPSNRIMILKCLVL